MNDTRAIDLLFEITHALLSDHKELEPKFNRVLKLLEGAGLQRGVVALHDEASNELRIVAANGLTAAQRRKGRYRPGEGVLGQTFERKTPKVVPSIAADASFLNRTESRDTAQASDTSFVCVPIATAGDGPVLGTLCGERLFDGTEQMDDDVRLLSIIAAVMADVIRTWRAHSAQMVEVLDRRDVQRSSGVSFDSIPNVLGTTRRMAEVARLVESVSRSDATVLLRGESGTGKELVASAIHAASDRRSKPFITVNCGALPDKLVETELFGHVRGAFTGASRDKQGRFQAADGGTIFLDEVGELPLAMQVKLLRVLAKGEVHPVGGTDPEHVSARVIAATNVDLEKAMEQGTFREDLYYRLNVFPIFIPPLRERKGDITLLIDHFVRHYSAEHGRDVRRVSSQAIEMMTSYQWPGNVRELENCVLRAVLLATEGTIRAQHLPPTLQTGRSSDTALEGSFTELMAAYEREILIDAMTDAEGILKRAAERLCTTPRVLAYRLKKHGLHATLVRARQGEQHGTGERPAIPAADGSARPPHEPVKLSNAAPPRRKLRGAG